MIRPDEIFISVRAEAFDALRTGLVEAGATLRQAQGERFTLQSARSIAQTAAAAMATPVAKAPATPMAKKAVTPTNKTAVPTTAAAGGGEGKAWVNTKSNTYHCNGIKYYGKTRAWGT